MCNSFSHSPAAIAFEFDVKVSCCTLGFRVGVRVESLACKASGVALGIGIDVADTSEGVANMAPWDSVAMLTSSEERSILGWDVCSC